jgi:hypothetical protein
MEITKVEPILRDRFYCVRFETDQGITRSQRERHVGQARGDRGPDPEIQGISRESGLVADPDAATRRRFGRGHVRRTE